MWKRIAAEFRKEVLRESRDDDDDFDDEANAIAIGIIVLGLLIGAFFLIRPLFRDKPVDPVYTKLEAIKHVQDLTLVKQHYTSLIPVTKKNKPEVLEFLLRAPVEVHGMIDLSEVEFVVEEDSLITVYLPPAEIENPYLDIEQTEVYSAGKTLVKQFLARLAAKDTRYLDAYEQIVNALDAAEKDVLQRAITNDIEEQTLEQAEQYLGALIGSLGYRVQFVRPILVPGAADSTLVDRLRSQLIDPDVQPANPADRNLLRRILTR